MGKYAKKRHAIASRGEPEDYLESEKRIEETRSLAENEKDERRPKRTNKIWWLLGWNPRNKRKSRYRKARKQYHTDSDNTTTDGSDS